MEVLRSRGVHRAHTLARARNFINETLSNLIHDSPRICSQAKISIAPNKIAAFILPDARIRKKPYSGNSQNPEPGFSEFLSETVLREADSAFAKEGNSVAVRAF